MLADCRKSSRYRTFRCGDDVEVLCGCGFGYRKPNYCHLACVSGRFRRGSRDASGKVRDLQFTDIAGNKRSISVILSCPKFWTF